MRNKRLYNIWSCMKQRCCNPNHTAAPWYHFKGIRVCDEWLNYEKFEEWAMSNGYTDELTIDRIDSDRNYEPDNCRWITIYENRRNALSKSRKIGCATGRKKGRFMVVQEPRPLDWSRLVKVVCVGLSKSEALRLSNELCKKDCEHFYFDRVTDGHKVGDIVNWYDLRRCLNQKKVNKSR